MDQAARAALSVSFTRDHDLTTHDQPRRADNAGFDNVQICARARGRQFDGDLAGWVLQADRADVGVNRLASSSCGRLCHQSQIAAATQSAPVTAWAAWARQGVR